MKYLGLTSYRCGGEHEDAAQGLTRAGGAEQIQWTGQLHQEYEQVNRPYRGHTNRYHTTATCCCVFS